MRLLAITWGVGGVLLVLASALRRLVPLSVEALSMDLGPEHALFLALWLPLMAWAEGYRGFQRRFSPRVVARAWHLGRHPRALHMLLAPLFCMGFFHATRRRMASIWALTFGIVAMVLAIRVLPQPWRGLVDLGVVVGLGWGALSLGLSAWRLLRTGQPAVDPALPSAADPVLGIGAESPTAAP